MLRRPLHVRNIPDSDPAVTAFHVGKLRAYGEDVVCPTSGYQGLVSVEVSNKRASFRTVKNLDRGYFPVEQVRVEEA